MTEPAVDLLRRGYAAMARGDFDEIAELLDDDVEMHDRPESPDASSYRGKDGAFLAYQTTIEYFDDLEMIPEKFHDDGDRIVVVLLMRGRGKGSGVPVEERIAHLWTMRDGRLRTLQAYTRPEDALAAAGIEAV